MAWLRRSPQSRIWVVRWVDGQGKVRQRSTRTTERRAAQAIRARIEAAEALRREGVVDERAQEVLEEGRRPLREHLGAYLRHLRAGGRAASTVADADRQVSWAIEATGATRLSDLRLDALLRALEGLQAEGLGARTRNAYGQATRAFLRWAVRTGRLGANPLEHLPRLDEARDRRYRRRALSAEELARLFAVADRRGRGLWYRLAYYAGLRLGDLQRLAWGDVDLERGVLVVAGGKARRRDEVPLHPELARLLAELVPGPPAQRVFPRTVGPRTRARDFERAGIEPSEGGEVADLHSLRVTLATDLARAGVPPQIARRILRHATIEMTLRYYTRLELRDDRGAIASLPGVTSAVTSSGTKPGESGRDGAPSTPRAAGS